MPFRTFETEEEFLPAAAEAGKASGEAERARIAAIGALPLARSIPR